MFWDGVSVEIFEAVEALDEANSDVGSFCQGELLCSRSVSVSQLGSMLWHARMHDFRGSVLM